MSSFSKGKRLRKKYRLEKLIAIIKNKLEVKIIAENIKIEEDQFINFFAGCLSQSQNGGFRRGMV